MAANMYRVGDYVYFETSSTAPYQIRRIEELCKTTSGTVEAKVTCFYRRRDLSSALIALADKHHAVTEDVLENGDSTAEEKIAQLDDKRRHELKCHEVFLSRQVETLPATHIRGKCSVTLLSEAETPLSYLDQDDVFFYSLVYDNQQKSLIADHGEIRVGLRYQVEIIPDMLESPEQDTRNLEELEELVWDCSKAPPDQQIDQFMILARAIGTFSRALDSTSAVRQPSLHMSAAAASRDITLLHAVDALHQRDYNVVDAIKNLVSGGGPVLCRDEMEEWSASEANLFEEALDKYGKSFREIGLDFLPWKSLPSIVEYYYMWKTTDRYVQQKRIKAAEAERKLKQVYIPPYNKVNPAQIGDRQNGLDGRPCESCFTVRASQWFLWGPQHLQCRLCASCWTYWKKYGGLKRPASRVTSSQERDGIVDGQLQSSIVKMQRCTLNGCGKEFRAKGQLVRHLADAHGILLQPVAGADSPSSLLAVSGVGNAAVKTRAAFCLVTTPLTRLSRQICQHVLNVRRSARQPFHSINIAAVKQECQQRLPDLLKLVRRLHAKKRQSMLQVSARLGINVDTDKPAILARSSAKAVPTRYAFPASSTQNSVNSAANNPTRKRPFEQANGTEPSPAVKRLNTDGVRPQMSIKTTEPKMRGSAVSLQNGGVSSGGRVAGGPRARKHTSVSVDTLDDVCFKSDSAFRKRRKQQITTLAIRRGARKPWQLVVKTSNSVDSSVILLD